MNVDAGPRRPYHHGDLRNALLQTSLALVREGGPQALSLRVVSRRVGVSTTAVYHHFADLEALRHTVGRVAREQMAKAMRAELATVSGGSDAGTGGASQEAVERFAAVGRGYVRFALAEPGLFAAAFPPGGTAFGEPGALGNSVTSPAGLLLDALGAMADLDLVSTDEVAAVATSCWAGVHGLSTLLLGPLAPLDGPERERTVEATLGHIVTAVCAHPSPLQVGPPP